jgi:predicted dehydrogenase
MRKIAIAGLGAAAKTIHLPAYRKLPDVQVVGGFDPAAKEGDFPFPLFSSAAEMIDKSKPDIVAVVTPPVTHQELCNLALNAGCHVFCEKPFMPTLEQAREVCALARKVDRRIVVNNQYRFMNFHRQAKQRIGSAEFGDLLFISANQTFHTSEHTEAGWRGNDPQRTCKEFGVHVLDLCRFFFDEDPSTITARMPKPRVGSGPDLLNLIQLEFSNDRVAHITLDRLVRGGPQNYLNMRLDGTAGCIQTRIGGGAELAMGIRGSSRKPYVRLDIVRGGESRLYHGDRSQRLAEAPFDLFAHGTAELMRAFLDALDRNETPPCNGEDNTRTLALVFAAYESDAQRSTIRMNYDG